MNGVHLGPPSWISGFVQILKKTSKIGSKVIKTIKYTTKRSKYFKNALKKIFLTFFLRREIEIVKNMPVKIWLPWKRQVTWTVTCHIKLLPDKF